jgi:hypothetical protein
MTVRAGAGVADCTNAGLGWGFWPCSLILSLGWAVVRVWLKVTDRLEWPSPDVFLSVCSSKLVRQATLVFRFSNSSWKWGSRWAHSSSYMFLLEIGCCRLVGDLYFNLLYVFYLPINWCMHMDANVYMYMRIREFIL